eukprot:5090311-Alexandrium_andersonii.AAC.1
MCAFVRFDVLHVSGTCVALGALWARRIGTRTTKRRIHACAYANGRSTSQGGQKAQIRITPRAWTSTPVNRQPKGA